MYIMHDDGGLRLVSKEVAHLRWVSAEDVNGGQEIGDGKPQKSDCKVRSTYHSAALPVAPDINSDNVYRTIRTDVLQQLPS